MLNLMAVTHLKVGTRKGQKCKWNILQLFLLNGNSGSDMMI